MNKQTFAVQMLYLYEYLEIAPNKERNQKYWDLLNHLSDEDFSNAVKNVVKEFIPTATVPFPLVAHFLKYCGLGGKEQASHAISLLRATRQRIGAYNSVSFGDPALHFVVQSFGGWPVMCRMSDKEWDINEGRMVEAYKSAQFSNVDAPDHLSGISESDEGHFTLALIPPTGYQNRKEIRCKGSVPAELGFKPCNSTKAIAGISDIIAGVIQ
jgi:hypothetical protein